MKRVPKMLLGVPGAVLVLGAVLTGCASPGNGAGGSAEPLQVYFDANPGFSFLEPLAEPAPVLGTYNPALQLRLTIESSATGAWETVSRGLFSTKSEKGAFLLYAEEDRKGFVAHWSTAKPLADLGAHRFTVYAGDLFLGRVHAEVIPYADGAEPAPGAIPQQSYVPVRFRVTGEALTVVGPEGGTVTGAEGRVRLTWPPGSVSRYVRIGIDPVESDSAEPRLERVYVLTPVEAARNAVLRIAVTTDQPVPSGGLRVLYGWDGTIWTPLRTDAGPGYTRLTAEVAGVTRVGLSKVLYRLEPADPVLLVNDHLEPAL